MKVKEHTPGSHIVLAPTIGEQGGLISLLTASVGLAFLFPVLGIALGIVAFLTLLYIAGELIGYQVIVDKAAGSITIMKRYFLLVAKQRVITFDTVVNVGVARVGKWGGGGQYSLPQGAYGLRIHYHSEKGLRTFQIGKVNDEDPARRLAASIRRIIGGKALKRAERAEMSLVDYSKAIELNPNDADAYYNRGCTYAEAGEYDKAIADYSKVIEMEPGSADAHYNRGCAYSGKGEVGKAAGDLQRCIELSTDPELMKAAEQELHKIR